jgi:hypothetical protein
MKTIEYDVDRFDYYKNNGFPAVNHSEEREEVLVPQVRTDIEAKPVDEDTARSEREEQMEAWMSDIKAFIRAIDISKL